MSDNNVKTITLGCRLNFYESEMLKSALTKKYPDENIVVVNTCAVTHEAERQSKQAVRKSIRENNRAKIIVTGCAAQTSSEYFAKLDGIFEIIKNEEKCDYEDFPEIPIFEGKSRAFLQIQNGCDNLCSFCIVPYTRGKSQSMPIQNILEKIQFFVNSGFKEVVFSGIDITSYGKDFEEKIEFSDVLRDVLDKFPELLRIRISSLDPNGVTDKLFNIITSEIRILPHIHLSVQSGDNHILKLMRRRHSREDVIKLCNDIRKKRENIVFGADFITGFPGEDNLMFKNTMNLVKEANISLLHIFPYSPRKGTLASTLVQLPYNVIHERAKILRQNSEEQLAILLKSFVGKTVNFMVEREENGVLFGKTDHFLQIKTEKSYKIGEIVTETEVISSNSNFLIV
ncbi:MAG: MiaB/RimO family radical SAM methylthiotransferase [Holosporales bacterium]|jgi:threonylcarbamoyladenosine tRNA methylthiotransferase MtaB|nr:MiaB/RimO family radical SAM methylthiotransferase [Holosporales bacterium]